MSPGTFLKFGCLKRHFLHFEGTFEQNIKVFLVKKCFRAFRGGGAWPHAPPPPKHATDDACFETYCSILIQYLGNIYNFRHEITRSFITIDKYFGLPNKSIIRILN